MSLIIPAMPTIPETCVTGAGTSWVLTEDIDQITIPRHFTRQYTLMRYAATCKRLYTKIPLADVLLDLYHRRMRSPVTGKPYPIASFVMEFCMMRESLSRYTRVRQAWVIMFRILLRSMRMLDDHFPVITRTLDVVLWPPSPMVLEWMAGTVLVTGPSAAQKYMAHILELEVGEVVSGRYRVEVHRVTMEIEYDATKNGYELHPCDPTEIWKGAGFGVLASPGTRPASGNLLWRVVEAGRFWDEQTDEEYKKHIRESYARRNDSAIWPVLCEYTFL
jgi:hypothetical protein